MDHPHNQANMNTPDCDWLQYIVHFDHKIRGKGLYISHFDMLNYLDIQSSICIQADSLVHGQYSSASKNMQAANQPPYIGSLVRTEKVNKGFRPLQEVEVLKETECKVQDRN